MISRTGSGGLAASGILQGGTGQHPHPAGEMLERAREDVTEKKGRELCGEAPTSASGLSSLWAMPPGSNGPWGPELPGRGHASGTCGLSNSLHSDLVIPGATGPVVPSFLRGRCLDGEAKAGRNRGGLLLR